MPPKPAAREPGPVERAGACPTVAEIARIIGRTPTDPDDTGCDAACATDGGTCICAELYAPAARKIIALFARQP